MAEDDEGMSIGELFDIQTNAIDLQLINLVKERLALYDMRVPQKDRTKAAKEALWEEVCECMQNKLKPLAAEMRWKYLRENYIKARKKQRLKEELAKKTGVPLKSHKYNRKYAYRYYEQMSFLNDALDHQKMLTLKNIAKQTKCSNKKSEPVEVQETQETVSLDKIEPISCNDGEEEIMTTDALFDRQYETVSIAIPDHQSDLSINSSTIQINHQQSGSSLNTTVKNNNGSSVNYEHLFLNYLQKTTEKPSPIDGFLARLGEGLKKLPYRERSKLELEFLTRLNQVEEELGLFN